MSKKKHAHKTPKFDPRNQPKPARQPKVVESVESLTYPVWRLSHMDWDGPWCPSKCKEDGVRQILERLGNLESVNWVTIKAETGSHIVGAGNICKEARKRLTERKLDEWADHLTSLRMGGKERLWGFLRGGIFHALWWDPEHQVYPTKKKHT